MSLYSDTPEGSEVDALEYANEFAERLFYLAFTGQIADKPYVRCARWLDSVPGAGEYFRALCLQEYTEEEKRSALWHGAWVMENVAQWQNNGQGKCTKKVIDPRRVKTWR